LYLAAMPRIPFLLAVPLLALAGCQMFSDTVVVRPGEVEREVAFESPDAEDVFRDAVKRLDRRVSERGFGNEWLTMYSHTEVRTDAAQFNLAAARCDRNHDGAISYAEAAAFAERVK
jgi:hypothetical protein